MKRKLFRLVALGFIAALAAEAQSTTDGAIGGSVVDPSGAVVPGVSVSAKSHATNASATATTDGAGRFTLIRLAPGVYDLEITGKGFAPVRTTDVTVEVGRVTTQDVALSVQGTTTAVSVSGEAPVVNLEQQDFSTNINQVSINNLPINGRRWFNFALMTPGTAVDGGFGDISFRGISGLLNNNTVDGADNNQAFFSEEKGRTRIAYSTSQASIQEFQVNTSTYSAEYGRAAGGVINAVTKSGTNSFHGGVFYYNRNQSLGAYTPYATQPTLINGAYLQAPVKPLDIRQQFGGDIGGYILKDKLFFYYNNDEQVRHFPAVSTPSNPTALFGALSASELNTLTGRVGPGTAANLTAAQIGQFNAQVLQLFAAESGTAARTGNQMLNFPKLDWRLNDRNTVTAAYTRLRWTSPFGVQTNAVVARGLDSFGDDYVKDDTGTLRWNATITPTITNELRFQYSRDFEFEFANPPHAGVPLSSTGYSPDISLSGAAAFDIGQPYYTQRNKYPEERRTQIADSATFARGTHLLKFGADVNHVGDAINYLNTSGGEYYYNNRVDFISDFIASQSPAVRAATKGMVCGTAAVPLPCYNEYQQGFGPLGFQFSTMDYNFFAQDQWHVRPRLTLNLGLRYEFEKLPSPQIANPLYPATSTFHSDSRDFGPRVGFAWDVTGNGKMSVRGGYGLYYGRIINGTVFNAIANTGVANAQVQATIFPTSQGAIGPIYPNVVSSLTGTVAKPNILFLPGDLRNPMIHEYDMVIEREVAHNTVVSLSWLGSHGRFLPTAIDTNLPAPSSISYNIVGGSLGGNSVTVPFYKGVRPNSAFNQITMLSTSATSNYNAGVLALNRRMTQGLQVQVAYTLADSTDDLATISATPSGNAPSNPFNLKADRGPSNFDVRHRFAGSLIWQPAYFDHASVVPRALLSGWNVAPIFTVQSGLPVTPTVSGNPPSGLGNAASGILGAQGSTRVPFLERNSFRLPSTGNVDLRVSRTFRLQEHLRMELIAEGFNIFNHVNYTGEVLQLYTMGGTAANPTLTYFPSFGTLNAANNNNIVAARQIQFGMRLTF